MPYLVHESAFRRVSDCFDWKNNHWKSLEAFLFKVMTVRITERCFSSAKGSWKYAGTPFS